MKILNLYAGIGGNRKLWGDEHKITAVENNPDIAKIYCDFFPKDEMIIADAHEFLLKNFGLYDFIWSSPPCPSHSVCNNFLHSQGNIRYPDMELWQEIIFLRKWFKGKYCVENVVSYYDPFIPCVKIDRHYFWSNFCIKPFQIKRNFNAVSAGGKKGKKRETAFQEMKKLQAYHGIVIENYKSNNFGIRQKTFLLRNCVYPPLGLHILNESKIKQQPTLF